MSVVERKRPVGRRLATKGRPKDPSDVKSRKTVQPTAAEHQIAEVERTFSDRWEW